MKTLKSILGYSWAVVAFLVMLILFPSLDSLSEQVTKLPFMKINPIYLGGEKDHEINKVDYIITINKPVFESLIGTPDKGFVQVKWEGKMPVNFKDTIDYNNDSKTDFIVEFKETDQAPFLTILNKNVLGINSYAGTEKGWIVRIDVRN